MFFRKKKQESQERTEKAKEVQVEILVEKKAAQEVIEKAKKSSRMLNDILEENHITIKIYKAAGGR